ncbi:hypothetical protein JCGZ_10609 [Jatropha curcas]|uniref:Aminotransferase-like plant mobile domain-containing protein n=1 Tax=Jatropha curcas TaxID=180498 RepID=A0A067JJR4_JATCU|nr:hypothetical protein JCGZ_10609 [Jatropha curcas]
MITPIRLHLHIAVESGNAYHPLWRALVERWWDTTDTFHIAIEEWTITPFEFAVLIGIHFRSHLLDVDSAMLTPEHLVDLLGFMLTLSVGGCTIVHDWGDLMDLAFVWSPIDLSLLREHDWGGAFMASMYHGTSQYRRRVQTGLGGTIAIWEWEIPMMSLLVGFDRAACQGGSLDPEEEVQRAVHSSGESS